MSFLVNPGYINPNDGSATYAYTSDSGIAQFDVGTTAYVPPGATLSFRINTPDNTGDPGLLTLKGFTTEDVPAGPQALRQHPRGTSAIRVVDLPHRQQRLRHV